jgi:hypothetical protein
VTCCQPSADVCLGRSTATSGEVVSRALHGVPGPLGERCY